MYAMSWERDVSSYKYETIQDPYSVEFEEDELTRDLSLDELLEDEYAMELEDELEEMI